MTVFGGRTSDFCYIPIGFVKRFISIAAIFYEHGVMDEITKITTLMCLENHDLSRESIGVFNSWKADREVFEKKFQEFLKSKMAAFHPAKWTPLVNTTHKEHKRHREFYCNSVIPWIHGLST